MPIPDCRLPVPGFALLEALLALFLLTLGVMGGALMQIHALRSGQQARLHTRAVHLAAELAENMVLYAAADAGRGQPPPFLAIDIDLAAGRGAPSAAVNCYGEQADCGAAAWAEFEIAEWSRRLVEQLPNARAVVCRDDAPWDAAAQSLLWRCAALSHGALVIKLGWRGSGDPETEPAAEAAPKFVLRVAEHA